MKFVKYKLKKIIKFLILLMAISSNTYASNNVEQTEKYLVKINSNYKFKKIQGIQNIIYNKNDAIITISKNDASGIIQYLNSIPEITNIEKDPKTFIPNEFSKNAYLPGIVSPNMTKSQGNNKPNDNIFTLQYSWQNIKGGDNILNAFLINNPKRKLNVAVLDSGFRNTTDLTWSGGYNFSSADSEIPVGPNYLDYDPKKCNIGHGQAVAEIIGAKSNNGYGIAGILNANMFAIRVQNCNETGYLSDVAKGIRWAAGDTNNVSNAPPIGVKIDLINLSLAGQSSYCPIYLQNAINYAVNKGIIIVVAAGNNSEDASKMTPANCNNVIVAGSVNEKGEQSDFSNYGNDVDVSALGEKVVSVGTKYDFSYWYGTSFSTPNTLGIIGLTKQMYPDLTYSKIKHYLKMSAKPLTKSKKYMGAGIVDADSMEKMAIKDKEKNKVDLRSVLNSGNRCTKSLYLKTNFISNICNLYQVNVNYLNKNDSQYYTVFKILTNKDFSIKNAFLVTSSKENNFIIDSLNVKKYKYGLQICNDKDGKKCISNSLIDLNARETVKSNTCSTN